MAEFETVLRNFFDFDSLPDYIYDEILLVNNSFNKCQKECIDGVFIVELHKYNQEKQRKQKSRREKGQQILKCLSSCMKNDNLRNNLISSIETMKSLLRSIVKDNGEETVKIQEIISGMTESKRKTLLKFKEKKENLSLTWTDDKIPREFLGLNSKIPFTTRCKHGECKWENVWKLISSQKMPSEFCDQMIKISIEKNSDVSKI